MKAFYFCERYLVAESWLGPAISALQGAVPADRRGTAQGVFSSLTAPLARIRDQKQYELM